jgi:DNA repair exonuclease SbcCD ATPase subunit
VKLTEIGVHGLKGAHAHLQLPACGIVLGPNQSGKSALLEAVRLLALGYAPGVGKPAAEILRCLSDGDELHVLGLWRTDEGKDVRLSRRWFRRDNGSCSCELEATGARNSKAAEAAFALHLGAVDAVLDLPAWLAMSASKRRDYLFGLALGTKAPFTKAEAWDAIEAAILKADPGDDFKASDSERDRYLPDHRQLDLDAWVQLVWQRAREDWTDAKAERARLKAVVSEYRQEGARHELPAERQRARLAKLEAEREELAELLRDDGRAEHRRQELRRRLVGLQERSEAIQTRLIQSPAPDPLDLAEAVEGRDRLAQELTELDEALEIGEIAREIAREQAAALETRLTALHLQCDLAQQGACPTCGQPVDVSESFVLEAEVLEMESDLRDLKLELEQTTTMLDRQRARRENVQAQRAGYQRHLDRAEDSALLEDQLTPLHAELADVEAELRALREPATEKRARLAALDEEIAQERAGLGAVVDLERQLRQAEQDLTRQERRFAVAAAVQDAAGPKGLKGLIAEAVLAPLERASSAVLGAAGLGKLQFVTEDASGKPTLEVWLVRDGRPRTPLEGLSGGESAAVLAALAAGFGEVSGAQWRCVLLDNIEAVDRDRRGEVLDALRRYVDEGLLSQVLAAGCPDEAEVPEGWTVLAPLLEGT